MLPSCYLSHTIQLDCIYCGIILTKSELHSAPRRHQWAASITNTILATIIYLIQDPVKQQIVLSESLSLTWQGLLCPIANWCVPAVSPSIPGGIVNLGNPLAFRLGILALAQFQVQHDDRYQQHQFD